MDISRKNSATKKKTILENLIDLRAARLECSPFCDAESSGHYFCREFVCRYSDPPLSAVIPLPLWHSGPPFATTPTPIVNNSRSIAIRASTTHTPLLWSKFLPLFLLHSSSLVFFVFLLADFRTHTHTHARQFFSLLLHTEICNLCSSVACADTFGV